MPDEINGLITRTIEKSDLQKQKSDRASFWVYAFEEHLFKGDCFEEHLLREAEDYNKHDPTEKLGNLLSEINQQDDRHPQDVLFDIFRQSTILPKSLSENLKIYDVVDHSALEYEGEYATEIKRILRETKLIAYMRTFSDSGLHIEFYAAHEDYYRELHSKLRSGLLGS